jgi:hypothetical protein
MDRFRLQPRRTAVICTAALALALGTGALAADAASAAPHKTPVTPKPGRYSGFVGPFSISFRVSSNSKQITSLASTFNPAADCGVPTNLETERFPKLAIRKGAFTGSDVFNPPSQILVFFWIHGSFSTKTRAGGTMHGHFSLPHNALPPCSVSTSFTASRVGK